MATELVLVVVALRVEAVVTTTGSLRHARGLHRDLDTGAWLFVSVGDSVEGCVAEINMAAARFAPVSIAAVAVILASVAGVVHGTGIGHFHHDAGAL